jgi:hypothetical protein
MYILATKVIIGCYKGGPQADKEIVKKLHAGFEPATFKSMAHRSASMSSISASLIYALTHSPGRLRAKQPLILKVMSKKQSSFRFGVVVFYARNSVKPKKKVGE